MEAHHREIKQSTLFPGFPVEIRGQTSKLRFLYIAQIILRVLVIGFALSGALIAVTSNMDVHPFGITTVHASYNEATAFVYKFIADCIVCGASLLSVALFIALNRRPKSNPKNYFCLFLIDLVTLVILESGCAAATAIGWMAKFGQPKMQIMAMCTFAGKFCDRITLSIASSYVAFVCLFVLTILSVHNLVKAQRYLETII